MTTVIRHAGSILFLGMHNAVRTRFAQAFANRIAAPGVAVQAAGMQPQPVPPLVSELLDVMGYRGTDFTPRQLSEVQASVYDVVVLIASAPQSLPHVFIDAPVVVEWQIDAPDIAALNRGAGSAVVDDLTRCAHQIRERVENLFAHGIWDALVSQKRTLGSILHSLSDGVIAHDMQRRIFFFNRSAQELTGFRAAEVIGQDCHSIFKPSLCGEECAFCDGCTTVSTPQRAYPSIFLDREGVRKEFEVHTIPLTDNEGRQIGVISSFSDKTVIRSLQQQLGAQERFWGIVGQDFKMQRIYDLVRDLAQSDFPVLVTGESGTGKELVARAVHSESSRRDRVFVPVNCGALPEGTLESELFGHVRGSFTGAIRDKKGRFELAHGGTLFLDEVAELTPAMQVKLLRVLQEGIIEPVGSESGRQVDVRIISATNRDLRQLVKNGAFREDLFYRLAVVPIAVPALRERRNDIPLIAQSVLRSLGQKLNRPSLSLAPETLEVFMNYTWPGNVRELQNALQFSMIKCRGDLIGVEHLPAEITPAAGHVSFPTAPSITGKAGRRPKLNDEIVRQALKKSGGNKARTARMLGVGRATLYNFINLNADLAHWLSEEFPHEANS